MVIETDEQRRWWFATHPQFSWGSKGTRSSGQQDEKEAKGKVRPEDVDAYVDEALKYERGPVAELLKSVKRNFGSEVDPWETQELGLGDKQAGGWTKLAQLYPNSNDGLIVPRLPTTKELFRLPKEMVRKFYDSLDQLLQNNPLLIDPNRLEGHHGLPKKFINYFLDCRMEPNEFIMIMRVADHRLKAEGEGRGGVHTGKGRGGDWITEWDKFIEDHPPENSDERRDDIRDKFNEMVNTFGLEGKYILSPKKTRRK